MPNPFQFPAVLTESSFGENSHVHAPLFTFHMLLNLACPPQVSNPKPAPSKFDPRKKNKKKGHKSIYLPDYQQDTTEHPSQLSKFIIVEGP